MDVIKSRTLGSSAMGGKIEAGAVRIGSSVCLMPSGVVGTVKAIEIDGKVQHLTPLPVLFQCPSQSRAVAKAGESCEIGLTEIEPRCLFVGSVLCTEGWPCPVSTKFECRIAVLEPPVPIVPGLHVALQAHAIRESGQISQLISRVDPKSGEVIKSKPRCLTKGQTALIEVITTRPICLESYATFRALGRITIRESGRTIAVGIVMNIRMDSNERKSHSL